MARNQVLKKSLLAGALTLSLGLTLQLGTASAEDLNGVQTTQEQTQQVQQTQPVQQQEPTQATPNTDPTGAEVVGELFNGVGVDAEASKTANSYMAPLANTANMIFAFILGITFIIMFVITALDLLYIGVPFIRGALYSGGQQQGGMGGMGGMGGQQQGSTKQFISDEAVAVVAGSQGGGGGGMGGGFGGGGFGGGGMGGGQPETKKNMLMSYAKKRIFFLVAFGVCAVLFSTTVFSDIGVKIGSWILTRLVGVEQGIPE